MLLCPQQAAAVPSSVFSPYRGELVISLKFIPPKKPAVPLAKGKNPTALASLKYPAIYCVNASGKKAEPKDGGELHVLIKEAKDLVGVKPRATLDTFVKGFVPVRLTVFPLTLETNSSCLLWPGSYLFPIEEKSTKRKTRLIRKNPNPHYDYIFVYKELSLEQLPEMCLELTVWDKETMVSNQFLGGVRLSSGKGILF